MHIRNKTYFSRVKCKYGGQSACICMIIERKMAMSLFFFLQVILKNFSKNICHRIQAALFCQITIVRNLPCRKNANLIYARFAEMMLEKTGWAATGAPNISMRTGSVSVIPNPLTAILLLPSLRTIFIVECIIN